MSWRVCHHEQQSLVPELDAATRHKKKASLKLPKSARTTYATHEPQQGNKVRHTYLR